MRSPKVVVAVVLVAAALSGCVGQDPIDGPGCGGTSTVEVVIDGATESLQWVELRTVPALRSMTSCVAPPDEERVPSTGPAEARGAVWAQTYGEVWLSFPSSLLRLDVDVPATVPGTLRLAIGAEPNATWASKTVPVARTESHPNASALTGFFAAGTLDGAGTIQHHLDVNTSWNQGVGIEAMVMPLTERAYHAAGTADAPRLAVHLIAPNGTRELVHIQDGDDLEVVALGPLTEGVWIVEVAAEPGDYRSEFDVHYGVTFRY